MNKQEIKILKNNFKGPIYELAIEICEQDPMFWSQGKDFCVDDIKYWVGKLEKLLDE